MATRELLLASFFGNLSMLLKSGVRLADAISEVATNHPDVKFKQAISSVTTLVENGALLSEAMRSNSDYFNGYMVASIVAAEKSGLLQNCFSDLAQQLSEQDELVTEIRSALVYPVFLVFTCLLSLFFIFALIIPQLLPLLDSAQQQGTVGSAANALIVLANFSDTWGKPLFILMLLAICVLYLLRHKINWRFKFIEGLQKLPFSRSLLNCLELARFFKAMGNLLNAGASQTQAISTAAQMLELTSLQSRTTDLLTRVNQGHRFGAELSNFGFAESEFSRLPDLGLILKTIEHAERAGQLPEALLSASDAMTKKFKAQVQKATQLIEPSLILLLGVVIGGVVYVIFSALQSVNGALF